MLTACAIARELPTDAVKLYTIPHLMVRERSLAFRSRLLFPRPRIASPVWEDAMAARILLVLGFLLGAAVVSAVATPSLSSPYSDYRQAVAANDAAAYGQFRVGFIELKNLP